MRTKVKTKMSSKEVCEPLISEQQDRPETAAASQWDRGQVAEDRLAEDQVTGDRAAEQAKILSALARLDELYGTTKEGFYHQEQWQLLAAIMLSAQSTDKQVDEALPGLFSRFPKADMVAAAPVEEIEDCIRSVGLYKNKAKNMKECCRQIMEVFDGNVPDQLDELLTLAGVGRKTATLYLADAYGIAGVTVDTHVFRISRRLGWASGKNPVEVERELMKALPEDHWNRINFQLIYHGRAVCTARKAHCDQCELAAWCGKIMESGQSS